MKNIQIIVIEYTHYKYASETASLRTYFIVMGKQTVLIFGATGATGSSIVNGLLDNGNFVGPILSSFLLDVLLKCNVFRQ